MKTSKFTLQLINCRDTVSYFCFFVSAVVMAKFARECLYKMWNDVKDLEVYLGPDTGDLSLRIGLHVSKYYK